MRRRTMKRAAVITAILAILATAEARGADYLVLPGAQSYTIIPTDPRGKVVILPDHRGMEQHVFIPRSRSIPAPAPWSTLPPASTPSPSAPSLSSPLPSYRAPEIVDAPRGGWREMSAPKPTPEQLAETVKRMGGQPMESDEELSARLHEWNECFKEEVKAFIQKRKGPSCGNPPERRAK
jgi:hypothetical protein